MPIAQKLNMNNIILNIILFAFSLNKLQTRNVANDNNKHPNKILNKDKLKKWLRVIALNANSIYTKEIKLTINKLTFLLANSFIILSRIVSFKGSLDTSVVALLLIDFLVFTAVGFETTFLAGLLTFLVEVVFFIGAFLTEVFLAGVFLALFTWVFFLAVDVFLADDFFYTSWCDLFSSSFLFITIPSWSRFSFSITHFSHR